MRAILTLIAATVTFAACATAHAQGAYAMRGYDPSWREKIEAEKLKSDQAANVQELLDYMDKQVTVLREKDAQFPGMDYGEMANQLADHRQWLSTVTFKRDGTNTWDSARAYVTLPGSKTMWLTDSFFMPHSYESISDKVIEAEQKKSAAQAVRTRMQRDIGREVRIAEQVALLIHERVHSNYQDVTTKLNLWDRGESQAYRLEYKWLRVLQEDARAKWRAYFPDQKLPAFETTNCLTQLRSLGVIVSDDEDAQLKEADEELGRELVFSGDTDEEPPVTLPKAPDVPEDGTLSSADAEARLREIDAWEQASLSALRNGRESDPKRRENRDLYSAMLGEARRTGKVGKDRELTCSKCGFSGVHWWFEDRWSCPACEHCKMPSEVLMRDSVVGFRQYAMARMRVYDQRMMAIGIEAERMRAEVRRAAGMP